MARGAGCSDSQQAAESQAQPAPHSTDRASPLSEDPDRRGDMARAHNSAVGAPGRAASHLSQGQRACVSHHRLRSTRAGVLAAGRQSFRIQGRAILRAPQPRGRGHGRPTQTGASGPGPQDAPRSASPRSEVGATSPTQVPPRPGAARPKSSPQTQVRPVTPRLRALNGLPGLDKVRVRAGPWRASRGPGRPSAAPRHARGPPPLRSTHLPNPLLAPKGFPSSGPCVAPSWQVGQKGGQAG